MRSCLVTLALGILFAGAADARRQKPLKELATYPGCPKYICKECIPRELVLAPGIGFDLTSSYATVAVRYHNGTVVDVGRVDGGEEYVQLMKKFGGPYRQDGPPFDTTLDEIRWNLDQASRAYRHLRGMPSTVDIEDLAYFLIRLKYFTSSTLRMPISRLAISLPVLPNLQWSDWEEAVAISGLDVLRSYKHYGDSLYTMNAAWAGMGYGLCEHWQDIEKCEEEEASIRSEFVLGIGFTSKEMWVTRALVENAHQRYTYLYHEYPDLGYDNWKSNIFNSTFWDTLSGKVAEAVLMQKELEIEDLVLVGEYAEEKMFLDAVWKALGDVTPDVKKLWEPLQVSGFNAEFVAARGSAEFAKRWQGETWDCVEGDWCEGNRDSEGGKEEV